jgi:Uma2 family endonuclease
MGSPLSKTEKYTYWDYLKFDDEKRYEVIYGELIMVPAPNTEHQHFSRNLEFILWNYVRKNKLGQVYDAPIDVVLNNETVVQPDIIFISNQNKEIIKEKGIFGSPDLTIEIISPSSKYRDSYEKKDLYESFKIKEYWLVDPKNKNIEVFSLNENGKYELFCEGFVSEENNTIKSNVLKGIEVKLEEIFE